MLFTHRLGLAGFFCALVTVIWHLLHCGLPLIMPLLLFFGLPAPPHLHHFKIPFVFTLLSVFWIAYYLLRKKLIIFWPGLQCRKRC